MMTPHDRSQRNIAVVAAALIGLVVGIFATYGSLEGADKLCHTQCVELGDVTKVIQ